MNDILIVSVFALAIVATVLIIRTMVKKSLRRTSNVAYTYCPLCDEVHDVDRVDGGRDDTTEWTEYLCRRYWSRFTNVKDIR